VASRQAVVAVAETIRLDPSAVATARTEVDLTPFISAEGVDWGDAAIEAYMAQGERGAVPVDYDIPNRQVTIPLRLQARGTVTFDTIRRQVQAKASLFQREGGWLSRVTSAGTLYADVVNATLRLGGDWMQAHRSIDTNASLSLELVPDWYGSEITLDDKTETTALALTTVLKQSTADAVIAGDYPARCRIVVDEDDAETQLGLIWGLRSRYYDSVSTAALTYQAEALTPLDTATAGALTGASGTAVTHSSLRTDWTAVLSTLIVSGSAQMTHRGTYRVWVRCYSTSTTPPALRFVWKVGDLVNPDENDRATIPGASNFYWLDLGEIRLDAPSVGTHQWAGRIEAIGDAGGENVSIDAVHFVPVDEGYGVLRAPQVIGTPTAYSVSDDFTSTTSGNALNARVAPLGGTWATSGAATDFVFADADHLTRTRELLARTTTSDASQRFAVVGSTNYAAVIVETQIANSTTPASSQLDMGVIARWTNSSNHLRATLSRIGGSTRQLEIRQVVAGVETQLVSSTEWPFMYSSTGNFWRLVLTVNAAGRAVAQVISTGDTAFSGPVIDTVLLSVEATTSVLATGGTLATGLPGIHDRNGSATAITRNYDSVRVAVLPPLDATIYPSQSLQLGTDGIIREGSAGGTYADAPHVGSLPRLPPSGLESRKVELYLKASRGDFDTLPDTGIDDISAQAFYRPSWLIAPGS
jgi:hypothetical protein